MKKVVSIVLGILVLTIAVIVGYEKESILIKQKEVKMAEPSNAISYYININKKNELGQPLSDVIFKVRDLNGNIEQIIPEYQTKGNYYLSEYVKYDPSEIMNIIPEKEEIEKIKTIEDAYNAYNNGMDIECGDTWCEIYTTVPFILEEVKVPSGYIKEKYILILDIELNYDVEDGILLFDNYYGYVNSLWYIESNAISDFTNFKEKLYAGDYDQLIKNNCPENDRRIDFRTNEDRTIQLGMLDLSEDECVFNIINRKGTIDLKINNFVNEKTNITTTNNKTLKYKIEVENKGTASSTENTITTEIPKGLKYVENSASHNGEYDREDHEISWRIDEINAEEKVELTYEAIVPKDADPNMKYIGKTSINSKEVVDDIKSQETVVTIMDNPKTSNLVNFIILLLIGITVSTTYFTTVKRTN